jgi:hypothetical protein
MAAYNCFYIFGVHDFLDLLFIYSSLVSLLYISCVLRLHPLCYPSTPFVSFVVRHCYGGLRSNDLCCGE